MLLGDDSAPGPVLKSDENSRVFIYFVDHGGAGLICTPVGDWIYADELDSTLQTMKDTGMFKELVFYLEACESGSMFPNLDATENIFAMTASNATLSSWAAYCGSDAYVDGTYIGSCLGDLFSINWMEDTEANNPETETLEEQYNTVVALTTASPVQRFGNYTFKAEPIADFQGSYDGASTITEKMVSKLTSTYHQYFDEQTKPKDMVSSRDVDLHYHYNRVMREGTQEAYADLQSELEHRQSIDALFSQDHFTNMANAPEIPQNFDCLRMMVRGVEDMCGEWTAYSLQYVRKLANVCDTKTSEEVADIYVKIGQYCQAF